MKECKHLVKYIKCAKCGRNIHNVTIIKTKAEERLIKEALIAHAAMTLTSDEEYYPDFTKAAVAVLKERKKK